MTKINVVPTAEQTCEIVLGLYEGVMRHGKPERFVIQSYELSANGHYWPIAACREGQKSARSGRSLERSRLDAFPIMLK